MAGWAAALGLRFANTWWPSARYESADSGWSRTWDNTLVRGGGSFRIQRQYDYILVPVACEGDCWVTKAAPMASDHHLVEGVVVLPSLGAETRRRAPAQRSQAKGWAPCSWAADLAYRRSVLGGGIGDRVGQAGVFRPSWCTAGSSAVEKILEFERTLVETAGLVSSTSSGSRKSAS